MGLDMSPCHADIKGETWVVEGRVPNMPKEQCLLARRGPEIKQGRNAACFAYNRFSIFFEPRPLPSHLWPVHFSSKSLSLSMEPLGSGSRSQTPRGIKHILSFFSPLFLSVSDRQSLHVSIPGWAQGSTLQLGQTGP